MKVLSVLRIAPGGVGGSGWELSRIVKSFAIDGRFVFAAEPGAYRLCKAEGYGRTGSMRNYLELPLLENPSPDPTFEIRKDEVSYLGRVSADVSPARSQKRGTKVVTVTHVRRRQEFLLKLADRASRTPWGDRLRSSATAEPSAADSLP